MAMTKGERAAIARGMTSPTKYSPPGRGMVGRSTRRWKLASQSVSTPLILDTKETHSVFSRLVKGTMSGFKKDPTVGFIKNRLEGIPIIPKYTGGIIKGYAGAIPGARLAGRIGRYAGRPLGKALGMSLRGVGAAAKFSFPIGLAVGALAMVGVGFMKGVNNASREIIAQRQIQDQRYARNITMMSRLGYTVGTSTMNRYNHTIGLSQSLNANRHGRGGY